MLLARSNRVFKFSNKFNEKSQNTQICHKNIFRAIIITYFCRAGNALRDRQKSFSQKMSHRWFLHGALDIRFHKRAST
jgi:hypothetical protein